MFKILSSTSGQLRQLVKGVSQKPLAIVIADVRFDPDDASDLDEYYELHEMECHFVQERAKRAVLQLAEFGINARLIPFVRGQTTLNGRRAEVLLPISGLEQPGMDVLVIAPVIYCTRDERHYIRAASQFEKYLSSLLNKTSSKAA